MNLIVSTINNRIFSISAFSALYTNIYVYIFFGIYFISYSILFIRIQLINSSQLYEFFYIPYIYSFLLYIPLPTLIPFYIKGYSSPYGSPLSYIRKICVI